MYIPKDQTFWNFGRTLYIVSKWFVAKILQLVILQCSEGILELNSEF